MHRQYTTYIKQDAIITIRLYLYIILLYIDKYNLNVIIASCLMYVVY